MPLQYSAKFSEALVPLIPTLKSRAKPETHDIEGRRKNHALIIQMLSHLPDVPQVEETVHHVEAEDGYQIAVHAFTVKSQQQSKIPTAGVLHCHGGGMIMGSVAGFSKGIANTVARTGIPFFSVDYRVAPEHTGTEGTGLVDDCYAGLVWLSKHTAEFNVDPSRIAVMGESAGGGIAAGVVLKARDKSLQPPVAKQVLIYPMLDDRNNKPIEALEPLAIWKVGDNITGWTALLGDKAGDPDANVPEYAAPARAKDLSGLPPTYIDCGGLDIFRDESIEYVRRLAVADIDVEFHLYPGVPHAFEIVAFDIPVSKQAFENRDKALATV
ncbi:triacylglycerol lipase [Exophiala viscosa]|uniref:Triacylglycerol lipase n=1 Tax=Exophiala viscosa TaxID=2486360 RepID=A0AAN6DSS9_9EURO|nr:triacylglycerol lipase [Exophiala viscosa]KAI1623116.1 triacylglycerol lipase [Exophiala viscosa]